MSVVAKWGNSLAIRLPKHIVEEVDLEEGSLISISIKENNILITPKRKKYTLDELLAGANPEDFEGELDWEKPVGEEIW